MRRRNCQRLVKFDGKRWETGDEMKDRGETVHIIYASNDGYAGHLAASMCSLLENNRKISSMDIYVLSVGMSREYQQRLTEQAEAYGRRLYVKELGDLTRRFPYRIDTRGFDISAMGRLFAPEVLPESVERALYLDCDTIIRGRIEALYDAELGDCLVGMVQEPTVYREMKEAIGFEPDQSYFNSGVILMDLKAWREKRVLDQLLEFYGAHEGSLFACDQDPINGCLKGRILNLSPRYNFFTNYRYFSYRTLVSCCAAYREVGEEEFKRAKAHPVIIHYLGDERPWIRGNHNHYRRLYRYYLGKTAWKDTPPQKGKELYMQLWWCFNQMTRICPGMRLAISRRLGMKVIDRRKEKRR